MKETNKFLEAIHETPSLVIPEGVNYGEMIGRAEDDFKGKLYEQIRDDVKVVTIFTQCDLSAEEISRKFQSVAKVEIDKQVKKLQKAHGEELEKLKKMIADSLTGKRLQDLVARLKAEGWILMLNGTGTLCYKHYPSGFPVVLEKFDDGRQFEYEKPICYIAGIYVDLNYTQITSGCVRVVIAEGLHPNVSATGEGCVGDLGGRNGTRARKIDVTDLDNLMGLLKDVELTYQTASGDSPYGGHIGYRDTIPKVEKEKAEVWTA